jgi:hypothetical protein
MVVQGIAVTRLTREDWRLGWFPVATATTAFASTATTTRFFVRGWWWVLRPQGQSSGEYGWGILESSLDLDESGFHEIKVAPGELIAFSRWFALISVHYCRL